MFRQFGRFWIFLKEKNTRKNEFVLTWQNSEIPDLEKFLEKLFFFCDK